MRGGKYQPGAICRELQDQVRSDDLLRVQALLAKRRSLETIASRILAVRTSNTEPARVEVETETGTRELIVPTAATELLSRLVQLACGDKRLRLAVSDDARIEAVEVMN